jgi:hypothetical protein
VPVPGPAAATGPGSDAVARARSLRRPSDRDPSRPGIRVRRPSLGGHESPWNGPSRVSEFPAVIPTADSGGPHPRRRRNGATAPTRNPGTGHGRPAGPGGGVRQARHRRRGGSTQGRRVFPAVNQTRTADSGGPRPGPAPDQRRPSGSKPTGHRVAQLRRGDSASPAAQPRAAAAASSFPRTRSTRPRAQAGPGRTPPRRNGDSDGGLGNPARGPP